MHWLLTTSILWLYILFSPLTFRFPLLWFYRYLLLFYLIRHFLCFCILLFCSQGLLSYFHWCFFRFGRWFSTFCWYFLWLFFARNAFLSFHWCLINLIRLRRILWFSRIGRWEGSRRWLWSIILWWLRWWSFFLYKTTAHNNMSNEQSILVVLVWIILIILILLILKITLVLHIHMLIFFICKRSSTYFITKTVHYQHNIVTPILIKVMIICIWNLNPKSYLLLSMHLLFHLLLDPLLHSLFHLLHLFFFLLSFSFQQFMFSWWIGSRRNFNKSCSFLSLICYMEIQQNCCYYLLTLKVMNIAYYLMFHFLVRILQSQLQKLID